MIYDRLNNKEQYYSLNNNFKKAFEFLTNTDLKNIEDDAYLEQLNGYKNYISNKLKKNVETYLYSIMDNKLKKLD